MQFIKYTVECHHEDKPTMDRPLRGVSPATNRILESMQYGNSDSTRPSRAGLENCGVICNARYLRGFRPWFKRPLFVFCKSSASSLLDIVMCTQWAANNLRTAFSGPANSKEVFVHLLQNNMRHISKSRQVAEIVPIPENMACPEGTAVPIIAYKIKKTVIKPILKQMVNSGCKSLNQPHDKKQTYLWENANKFPEQFVGDA